MSKKLVAFFSASGSTRKLANTLAEAAGADIYEIKPATPYTGKDLNWNDSQSRSSVEMADINSRPALAGTDAKIAAYDTIFLGFPIWWYVAPHIINSFLESYDFGGKTIVLFATSGGSGFGETLNQLKSSCAASVKWIQGKVFRSRTDKNTLSDWIKTLPLD
ncbi:MAG: NAD(P)H-dependent oxidoreductase [Selenomonadaceae bacterium]|nr:NAD(P)H-dependent oxidoreductase [Selenomonadaceae bacterium]MBQ7493418.1 NAD(P)H-dependent oxidoreductase [Selenomonadaceae bacterium]